MTSSEFLAIVLRFLIYRLYIFDKRVSNFYDGLRIFVIAILHIFSIILRISKENNENLKFYLINLIFNASRSYLDASRIYFNDDELLESVGKTNEMLSSNLDVELPKEDDPKLAFIKFCVHFLKQIFNSPRFVMALQKFTEFYYGKTANENIIRLLIENLQKIIEEKLFYLQKCHLFKTLGFHASSMIFLNLDNIRLEAPFLSLNYFISVTIHEAGHQIIKILKSIEFEEEPLIKKEINRYLGPGCL